MNISKVELWDLTLIAKAEGIYRAIFLACAVRIEGRRLTGRELGKCRLYIYDEARHSVPGLYLLDKSEFKCKSRGMETCLHFRGAALNARETGIYLTI